MNSVRFIRLVVGAILLLLLSWMVSACRSQQPIVVTQYHDRWQHDTITIRDSIYRSHTVQQRGDTIFVHDTIYDFKFRDKEVEVRVHDSVPYPVEVPKPYRQRNGYDKATARGFWVLLVLLILIVAWWVTKKFYLRR